MTMTTPPENQGQMIEISYGFCDGDLYRRSYDTSTREAAWSRADEAGRNSLPDSWHPVNGAPSGIRWTTCSAPTEQE